MLSSKSLTLTEFLRSRKEEIRSGDDKTSPEGIEMINYILLTYNTLISRKGNGFNTRPLDSLWIYEEGGMVKATIIRKHKNGKPLRITINMDKSRGELLKWADKNGRRKGTHYKTK